MHDWILILHLSRPRARACEWNRKGHRFASGNSTQSLHLSLRDNSAGGPCSQKSEARTLAVVSAPSRALAASRLIHDGQNVDRNLRLKTEAESLLGSKAGLIISW
jgi:hypothetical protein